MTSQLHIHLIHSVQKKRVTHNEQPLSSARLSSLLYVGLSEGDKSISTSLQKPSPSNFAHKSTRHQQTHNQIRTLLEVDWHFVTLCSTEDNRVYQPIGNITAIHLLE